MKNNWDWTKYEGNRYDVPAKEIYYLIPRWQERGMGKLLDLGCGMGRHSLLFARNGFQVVAYDRSEVCLKTLGEKVKENDLESNIQIVQEDMFESLPFEDNYFNYLVAYNVISHADSNSIQKVVEQLKRIMKPGGELFLNFCSKKSRYFTTDYLERVDENTIIKNVTGPEEGVPHYYSDEESLKALLKDFEILDLYHEENYVESGEHLNDSKHYFVLCRKG